MADLHNHYSIKILDRQYVENFIKFHVKLVLTYNNHKVYNKITT